jgi:hypothetical protein
MMSRVLDAWKEVEPLCLAASKAIQTCPIPQNEKAGLSLMALLHFLATAGHEFQAESGMKGDLDFHMREAAELALQSVKGGHKQVFKVVSPTPQGKDHD